MRPSQAQRYVAQSKRRQRVIEILTMPLTATQISSKSDLRADACRHVIGQLARHGIVECKNPTARRSRLYGLTELGLRCRKPDNRGSMPLPTDIDWELYGWVCYRHRSTMVMVVESGPTWSSKPDPLGTS
jgi:predicted transcriptional regulator